MTDLSMLQDFIAESEEHLEEMETNLLALEADPDNREVLDNIFRSAHTIKGSSEYLGMARIAQLSHKLESLLDLLRQGEHLLDKAVINTLIEGRDRMVELIQDLNRSQKEETDIDDILTSIEAILEGSTGSESDQAAGEPADDADGAFGALVDVPEASSPGDGLDRDLQGDLDLELGEDEIYDEETDTELFEIFIEQVKENLEALDTQLRSLGGAGDKTAWGEAVLTALSNLRSSANYMDYPKLTRFYDLWRETFADLLEKLPGDEDLQVTSAIQDNLSSNMSRVLALFPNIELDLAGEAPVEEGGDSDALDNALDEKLMDFSKIDESLIDGLLDVEEGLGLDEEEALSFEADDDADGDKGLRSLHEVDSAEPEEDPVADDGFADLGEDETYEEETDAELFEIFLGQLKDNLTFIKKQSEALASADNPAEVLEACLARINALRSSSNYMGYGELTQFYESWSADINNVQEALLIGEDFSISEFAQTGLTQKIGILARRFSQIADDDLIEGIEVPEEDILAEIETPDAAQADEAELLAILGSALDASMGSEGADRADSALQEIEDNLFSSEEAGEMPTEGAEAAAAFDTPDESDDAIDAIAASMEETLFATDEPLAEEAVEAPAEHIDDRPEISAAAEAVGQRAEAAADGQDAFEEDNRREHEERRTGTPDRRSLDRRRSDRGAEKVVKQSLRVDAKKIDALMNQVGELVVSRAWFSQLFNEMRGLQQSLKDTNMLEQRELKQVRALTFRLSEATVALGRVANELQEGVMKVRMLPISQLFNRYPRLVRDLVQDTDKKVQLRIKGEETELDKMIIEEISDPLIHIIRNAVDHGLEYPHERLSKGKPEVGTLLLEAYHESNHVVIEISDDGKGIDPAQVKAKALQNHFVTQDELERMSVQEVLPLIMKPGFSTAEKVTHTSGRGVGMDVVKKNIEKLNGTIEIDSKVGSSTRFRIKIPLTLAIIPALMVKVGEELFTVPLSTVEETLRIFKAETSTIEGMEVIHLRDETLPLVRLAEIFNVPGKRVSDEKAFVVIVSTGMQRVGLVVDTLIGQEEVVIKPLADYLQDKSGFSGATILGDGRISLILDVYELVNMSIGRQVKMRSKLGLIPSGSEITLNGAVTAANNFALSH